MEPPLLVRLPAAFAAGEVPATTVVQKALNPALREACAWRFALCPAEIRFARAVMGRHTQLWFFRSDQQRRLGDFVAVDMSRPRPDGRRVFAIELKHLAPLRLGHGGVQLLGVSAGLSLLAALGVVTAPVMTVVRGGSDAVARFLSQG